MWRTAEINCITSAGAQSESLLLSSVAVNQIVMLSDFAKSSTALRSAAVTPLMLIPSITSAEIFVPADLRAETVFTTFASVKFSGLKLRITRSRIISSLSSCAFEMFFFLAISANTDEYQEITFEDS